MDQTRQTIRRMLTEAVEEPEPYQGLPQRGDKGMLLGQAGWVSWAVKWPEGTPDHDEIQERHFRYDDIFAKASVMPLPEGGYDINLYMHEEIFGDEIYGIISDLGYRLPPDTGVYIDANDSFVGTLAGYKSAWYDHESEEEEEVA